MKDNKSFGRRDTSTYFAADSDSTRTAAYLKKKSEAWFDTLHSNKYIEKLRRSWLAYHGSYFGAYYGDSHSITFGGESGELTNIAVNHYRNIAVNIINMITASRPSFQARSVNTDYKSQVQTTLANDLLEYYLRDKRLEKNLKLAVEYSVVMGAGFIKMQWNATSGEIYDYIEPSEDQIESFNEEGQALDKDGNELKPFPVYQGDVEFVNMSPFDVVFDSTKESILDNDWVLCRTFKNKYDLMEKYPEYATEIEAIPSKSELQKYRLAMSPLDETDDVPMYEFFHRKTESLPDGRYILFLSPDIVLIDTIMPYRSLPIYRMSAGEVLGSPYGYTPMFDLLPLQDAVNSLYTTILTNQSAFGVQSILSPRGNDIRVNQVSGGMNFIEYNPVVAGGADGRPQPMNLTQTPPEIFNFLGLMERSMEVVSGINSVVRGNPESSLKSGNALALVQSQALQFMSGLQQSYIMLLEDIGTGLVQMLQDFASVPRIAAIVGRTNRTKMQEFSGKDIDLVNRVVVDVGNSLAQTTAGRVQMADNLIQMGLITDANQYFSVINTGNLDTMTEGQTNEMLLIRAENERLTDGSTPVHAIATDKHSVHIKEHMNVLADPDLRLDPDLNARVLEHIEQHMHLLRTTDPSVLAMRGEQPVGPPMGTPVAPESVAGLDVNQQGAGLVASGLSNPSAETVAASGGTLPTPAQPATTDMGPNTPQEALLRNS